MKTVKNKFKKELVKELPRALFDGRIEVIQSPEEAEKAVAVLEKAEIIGLDTETRPNFRGGKQNKVALLQVSTHEICFLFRLKMTGMTDAIISLFTNPAILKVGLSLRDDFRQLRALREFDPVNYVELQDFVKPFGIQDLSLQKLYANILGGQIHKGQQLSNWEADVLSDAQKGYAATDAWACIKLFEELQNMRKEGFYVIYEPSEVPEPVYVGMEKPKEAVEEVVSEEHKEEQSAESTSQPKKKRRKKAAVKVEENIKEPEENLETSPAEEGKDVNADTSVPEEKPKRHKRRKGSSKGQNIQSKEELPIKEEEKEASEAPKRSKRRKGNKGTNNGVEKKPVSTVDQTDLQHTKQPAQNAKKSEEIPSAGNEKKSRNNEKKKRNQKEGDKRREASRRSIPEMAAPLDDVPVAKKTGFMKKMLMGLVEKLT